MNYANWKAKRLRNEVEMILREKGIASAWVKNARKEECVYTLVTGLKPARFHVGGCPCDSTNHQCGLENTRLYTLDEPSGIIDVTVSPKKSDVVVDKLDKVNLDLGAKTSGLEGVLVRAVSESIGADVNIAINNAVKDAHAHLMDTFDKSVKDVLEGVEEKISELRKPLHITVGDNPKIDLGDTIHHPLLPDVIEALHHRDKVLLVGKAGTGKSTLVKQASTALGYDVSGKTHDYVYMCGSAGVTEGHLTGRMLFNGDYKEGLAVPPFENGGVLCADEFDGFDENCALVFNAMLDDQGVLAIPNRPDQPVAIRHEKFKFAGCANTYCDGADFSYSGRNQLDRATLDRFGDVTIEVDYDKSLERALVGEYSDTAQMLWSLRRNVDNERIERIISTRRFKDAHVWRKLGKSNEWIIKRMTTSWTREELDKVNYKRIVEEVA